MGAIAEAFAAYAQPLLDETDGSQEQLEKAFTFSQLCYNLALTPEEHRDKTLSELRQSLQMDDAEFDEFRRTIIDPMIQRHEEMFPGMHQRGSTGFSPDRPSMGSGPRKGASGEAYPGTDRYAPCPCNSGRKYKFCCGKKKR